MNIAPQEYLLVRKLLKNERERRFREILKRLFGLELPASSGLEGVRHGMKMALDLHPVDRKIA